MLKERSDYIYPRKHEVLHGPALEMLPRDTWYPEQISPNQKKWPPILSAKEKNYPRSLNKDQTTYRAANKILMKVQSTHGQTITSPLPLWLHSGE